MAHSFKGCNPELSGSIVSGLKIQQSDQGFGMSCGLGACSTHSSQVAEKKTERKARRKTLATPLGAYFLR